MEAGRTVNAVLNSLGCSIHPSPTLWECNANRLSGKIVDLMPNEFEPHTLPKL